MSTVELIENIEEVQFSFNRRETSGDLVLPTRDISSLRYAEH